MNTGIQDAYNLAWKLALVVCGAAPEALLDGYEAERRPVGADVVARTRSASLGYGREAGGQPNRLADTQLRVSYRGTGWVSDDGELPEVDVGVMAGGSGARRGGAAATRHRLHQSQLSFYLLAQDAELEMRYGQSPSFLNMQTSTNIFYKLNAGLLHQTRFLSPSSRDCKVIGLQYETYSA